MSTAGAFPSTDLRSIHGMSIVMVVGDFNAEGRLARWLVTLSVSPAWLRSPQNLLVLGPLVMRLNQGLTTVVDLGAE